MTNAAVESVIRVEELRKTYGQTRAVDGVTFDVRPGEVCGLLGPNGAGKTTTVEILEGLRTPDGGCATSARRGRPPQAPGGRRASAAR